MVKAEEVMETQIRDVRTSPNVRTKAPVKTLARAAEREKMLLSTLRALGFSNAEARESAPRGAREDFGPGRVPARGRLDQGGRLTRI